MSLRGKRVVVTGASSGIGRATAIEAARRGADVVIVARRAERLDEVAGECRRLGAVCNVIVADVSDPASAERIVQESGRVDVLINNAGFAIFDAVAQAGESDFHELFETNYFAAVRLIKAFLPQMLERRSGTIVNVASITGMMGFARMGGYGASKAALIITSESLRDEVIGKGVRVALVCPGTTDTEFFVRADRGKMPAASRLILAVKPGRVARVICKSAEDGHYRRIVPFAAAVYMRFKEVMPRTAHLLMRRVSSLLERP